MTRTLPVPAPAPAPRGQVDRGTPPRVATRVLSPVRRTLAGQRPWGSLPASGLAALLALTALGACGGKGKGGTTTPGQSAGSSGEVTYADQEAGAPAGGEPTPGDEPATGGTAAPGEGEEAPVFRPPGADLSAEKRKQVVAERLRLARQAIKSGDADGAIREARAALDAEETNVEAMIVLAHGYYLKEYDDKAEAILKIALKRPEGPKHPVLHMLLGLIADRSPVGREDDALASYEKACELKPDYANAWVNRGAIYLERKRYADAVSAFETVARLRGQSAQVHTNLGSAYRGRSADFASDAGKRDGFLRKAEAAYKAAINFDPSYPAARFNLGLLYLDADPYPGLETLIRLKEAMKQLNEYKRLRGPGLKSGDPVDDYVAAAQKAHDRELKRQEKRKAREARDAKKKKAGG